MRCTQRAAHPVDLAQYAGFHWGNASTSRTSRSALLPDSKPLCCALLPNDTALMLLPALIVALTVLLLVVASGLVGRARGKYGIKAPATTGHPAFERAFRAQMNTQEAALMFLPTLALAAWLGHPLLATALGAVWLLARSWYLAAYLGNADKRGPAFGLGALMQVALLVLVFVELVGHARW